MKTKKKARKVPTRKVLKGRRSFKGHGGANVELTEGPLDTDNHNFMERENIIGHVNEMKMRKNKLDKQYIELDEEYKRDLDLEKIEKKRTAEASENEKDRRKLDDIAKQTRNAKRDEQTLLAMGSIIVWFNKMFQDLIQFFSGKLSWSSDRIGYVISYISNLIISAIVGLFAIVKGLFTIVDKVVNGNFVKSIVFTFFKAMFSSIFAILFFVLVLVILIYGVSILVRKPSDGTSGAQKPDCPSLLEDGITININNFSKLFQGSTINQSVPTFSTDPLLYRPVYDMIPKNIQSKNPFVILSNWLSKWLSTSINNSPMLTSGINNIRYLSNMTADGITYVTGGTTADKATSRSTLVGGRSDNIVNVDASLISDKTMLRKKKIGSVGNVVNMGRPKDIMWTLPSAEYADNDLNKLPPELLKLLKVDKKKTIVIPWINKNNNYVLSCNDAYFKDTPTEKANVLIDNVDGKSCTFNIHDKTETFKQTKQRYADSTDLSVFFS